MDLLYDPFAPNFDMVYKTMQRVSVPTSNLFGSMKTGLWAKEVRKLSIMLDDKMVGWTFFCPPTWLTPYMEIFQTLNSHYSCIHWHVNLKFTATLKRGDFLYCVKVLSKKSMI